MLYPLSYEGEGSSVRAATGSARPEGVEAAQSRTSGCSRTSMRTAPFQ